jgi:hypothetical protein
MITELLTNLNPFLSLSPNPNLSLILFFQISVDKSANVVLIVSYHLITSL